MDQWYRAALSGEATINKFYQDANEAFRESDAPYETLMAIGVFERRLDTANYFFFTEEARDFCADMLVDVKFVPCVAPRRTGLRTVIGDKWHLAELDD